MLVTLFSLFMTQPLHAQVPVNRKSDSRPLPNSNSADALLNSLLLGTPEPVTEPVSPPEVLKQHTQSCFQTSRKRDVNYRGRIELTAHVLQGKVEKASVTLNQTGDILLGRCLESAAANRLIDDVSDGEIVWVFTSN